MKAYAFAPAHCTGVFAVHDEAPTARGKGSRGMGWSLARGATACVQEAKKTRFTFNGVERDLPVTADALRALTPTPLEVEIRMDVPQGAGFGTSAAGTLATTLAATHLLNLDPELALEVTHDAEVQHATGLGDAVGSWFGAGEIRTKPGCPPEGWAMRLDPEPGEFLFVGFHEELPTSSIIRDAAWKARTREAGDALVDELLESGRMGAWHRLLTASQTFTERLGLLNPQLSELRSVSSALSGQVMLGQTVWFWGTPEELDAIPVPEEAWSLRSSVDLHGARIVKGW